GVGARTRPSIRLGAGLPSGGGVGRGGTGDDGGGGAFRGVGARRGGRASRGARRSIGAHGIDAPRAVRGVLLGRVVVATCQRHEERGGETGGTADGLRHASIYTIANATVMGSDRAAEVESAERRGPSRHRVGSTLARSVGSHEFP